MLKVKLTPWQLVVMWKTLFFRKPSTVVFSESGFLLEYALNYASAVVFARVTEGEHSLPNGCERDAVLLESFIGKNIDFITIRECYIY